MVVKEAQSHATGAMLMSFYDNIDRANKLQQQPAILILNCEMAQKGLRTVSLQSPKAPNEISGDSAYVVQQVEKESERFSSKLAPRNTRIWLLLMLKHLLLAHSRLPHAAPTAAAPSEFQGSLDGTMDTEWKAVKKAWHQCSFCNRFA
ncbi:hypothetical protein JRO89_XS09G0224900 [Xanthoceras sorbifolium]|uniref:Uncharacterized protein n=1 Tax=Xanthoceras sorbifolium TaxID=99658 RepID=A0ABQ8HMF6_9ROSI|nr:hypothetical protein JRO89_XS09G0224900 [Xanthoceras sorbifolium]